MDQQIIHKVYDLIDEIKQLDQYKELIELSKMIEEDETVQNSIRRFEKAKNKYLEVKKYSSYHPDLDSVKVRLSEAKEALFTLPDIQRYKRLEKELQNILNQISSQIGQSVSKHIKTPNEMGLLQKTKGDFSG